MLLYLLLASLCFLLIIVRIFGPFGEDFGERTELPAVTWQQLVEGDYRPNSILLSFMFNQRRIYVSDQRELFLSDVIVGDCSCCRHLEDLPDNEALRQYLQSLPSETLLFFDFQRGKPSSIVPCDFEAHKADIDSFCEHFDRLPKVYFMGRLDLEGLRRDILRDRRAKAEEES